MTRPHRSLRATTNIATLFAWALCALTLSVLVLPLPIAVLFLGALLGVGGGCMQGFAFREKRESFLVTATAMDVRRALKDTKWGKRYIYFLWVGSVLLVVTAFLTSANPALAFLAGYFTMMFARESLTLGPTFELQRMQSTQLDTEDI